MKKKNNFSIQITNNAIKEIKKLISNQKKLNLRFRIYVSSGGCNGFRYGFMFDENKNKNDFVIKKSGIELIVDFKSLIYLNGGNVDYIKEVEGSYFKFINPNSKTICSCGFSFGI